jgi:hypothetical protein
LPWQPPAVQGYHENNFRRSYIRNINLDNVLVVLPDFVSRKLQDITNIEKVLRKCHAHMLLYGSVKRRNIQGKEMHLLNIEGMVRHSPIPVEISKKFSDDFGNAIPRKLMLTTESDALIFESASTWFDLSARYVIGVAAYLSGAVAYAERMLLQVEESLARKHDDAFIRYLNKFLPKWKSYREELNRSP